MKRLIFCFDGTWNKLSTDTPTNVVLTAASIVRRTRDNIAQIINYDEGVGTARLERILGGTMGAGLTQNIREAYRFLIFNYDPGDQIYVFGFSRGAFSAQTFVGFIRHIGPLRRLHVSKIDEALQLYQSRSLSNEEVSEDIRRFRSKYADGVCIDEADDIWRCKNIAGYQAGSSPLLKISYLGIWDTVSALGVPPMIPGSSWFNRRHAFHQAKMDSFVESARHAVAIDEHRVLFPVTLWGDLTPLNAAKGAKNDDCDAPYQEKWFPGNHGSVGGGGDIRGQSDGALAWVIKGAKKAGLVLDTEYGSRIQQFKPDSLAPLVNVTGAKKGIMDYWTTNRPGPEHMWQLSAAAIRRWHAPAALLPEGKLYRPKTLEKASNALEAQAPALGPEEKLLARHTVISGDQLGKLAEKYYGDASKWTMIFAANRDLIDDPDELFLGWSLRIPDSSTSEV